MSWGAGDAPEIADRLMGHLAEAFGLSAATRMVRHCPSCGSGRHGRPSLVDGGRAAALPHVSISRTVDLTLVAMTALGPVGVDVERMGAASYVGFDTVARAPLEASCDATGRTIMWVRKEAVLKATGHGLTVDPRQLRLTGPDEPPQLLSWSARPMLHEAVRLVDVAVSRHHCAAIAVLSHERPVVVVRGEARAVPRGRATW